MAHVNRAEATRYTRLAQAAALLLIGAGVGAVLLKFSPPEAPPASPGWGTVGPGSGGPEQPTYPDLEPDLVGPAIDLAGAIDPPAQPADPTPKDPDPVIIEPTGGPDGAHRYLGGLFIGETAFAVIGTPAGQHTVRVGQTIPNSDAEVVSIDRGAVELSTNGVRKTLSREAAAGAIVGSVDPSMAGISPRPQSAAQTRPQSRAEQNAATRRERPTRIDPESENFREQMERRREELERRSRLRGDD